ncbi:hypothetical protein TCAL_02410 [Tigriopus californicus]|uniref:Alpha 1,4-glycosyltransferase domain-containing protein n=1 Tax=Tigriopus californicus TaxID=6832 RepID=A0A553NY85_TIGCA|nr:hypothetical protein TCAL_02410 [Tigriopus californicus]
MCTGLARHEGADFATLNSELQIRMDELAQAQEEAEENNMEFDELDDEVKIFDELDPNEVMLNGDMFFFVSSGAQDLNSREACTVEAAAQLHPGRHIFVLFITPNITNIIQSHTLSVLLSYNNVIFRYIKVSKYLRQNIYLEQWFIESGFQESDQMPDHLTNALTYAMLNKFGGTALSFDVLLLRSISWMGDILPRCQDDLIESTPLTLKSKHPLALDAMEQMVHFHDSTNPKATGSYLLTQRLKKKCSVEFITELLFKECGAKSDAKVLTSEVLCPVEEDKHWRIFDPARTKLVLQNLKEHKSHGLKLWREYTDSYPSWGSAGKPTAFSSLAQDACPLINLRVGSINQF